MRLCANGVGPEPLIDYEDLCLLANLDDDGNLILKGPIGLSSDVLSRLKGLLEVYFPGQFFLLQNAPLKESAESVVTIGLGSVESKKPLFAEG